MERTKCPPHFNSAQQNAWREYVTKYAKTSQPPENTNWVREGADVYARYGVEFSPADYRDNPDKVCAALKVFGLIA